MRMECWILMSKNSAKLKYFHAEFLEEVLYVLYKSMLFMAYCQMSMAELYHTACLSYMSPSCNKVDWKWIRSSRNRLEEIDLKWFRNSRSRLEVAILCHTGEIILYLTAWIGACVCSIFNSKAVLYITSSMAFCYATRDVWPCYGVW